MTESLYLSPESSLRLNKLLDQMEDLLKTDPGSGLRMQLLRHNLFDLVRPLPLTSQTRKKTETLLSLTEKSTADAHCGEEVRNTILSLRAIYRIGDNSDSSAGPKFGKCVLI